MKSKNISDEFQFDDFRAASEWEMDAWNIPLDTVLFTYPELISLGVTAIVRFDERI